MSKRKTVSNTDKLINEQVKLTAAEYLEKLPVQPPLNDKACLRDFEEFRNIVLNSVF